LETRQDIHTTGIPIVCRSCEARHRGICGGLNPDQLMTLSKQTTRRVIEPGTALMSDGNEVTTYSNLLSGVVKLTKILSDGRQQIVGLQFAPDFVGRPFKRENSLDAQAATTVSLCSFPKSTIDRLIKDSPELEHRLLQQVLNELDEARNWMLTLGRKTAAEKVASFLFYVASHIDPEQMRDSGPVEFELPLTRAEIGDFLGLTIETVSRQFTKLRKDGVIEIAHNRTITVNSLAQIKRYARLDDES
jgi:CRP/FNR family transcriptional regulator, anaerobic regulatory protein